MHSETSILLSCIVGVFGVLGVIAALVARSGIHREEKILDRGSARLAELADPSASSPNDWLRAESAPPDSHFGDYLLSVWGGWLVGRIPTLMELHNLSAGRERRRLSARLTGGITGLLVISGIAGTLMSIHPILDNFSIDSNPAGLTDSAVRAGNAMDMIHGLGRAFWPSLTALLFTVAVAVCRGIYVHAASGLACKLDRFSIDVLFRIFRARTSAEGFVDIQIKLSTLINRLEQRDKNFEALLNGLQPALSGLNSAGSSLETAAKGVNTAADGLTAVGTAMRSEFGTHLGPESPVILGLAAIASAAEINRQAADSLRENTEGLAAAMAAAARSFQDASGQVNETISTIPQQIKENCAKGSKDLVETSRIAATQAATIIANSGNIAASRLNQSVESIPQIIDSSYARAKEDVVRAFGNASHEASVRLAAAATAAAASLQAEVAPIKNVATGINTSNAKLQRAVDEALRTSLGEFQQSSEETLTQFRTTIGLTADKLVASQEAATAAVEMADRVLRRVEVLNGMASWPARCGRWIAGLFQRK